MKKIIVLILLSFNLSMLCYNSINASICDLPDDLVKEIDSYQPIVNKIVDAAINGSFKNVTWQELEHFVDRFGARLTGSTVLEDSINYMLQKSKAVQLENVHTEPVKVPHWVRGNESATLLKPRKKDIAMLGLGYSIGTPPEGITAKVIVVNSFADLKRRASEIPGCIVVYNQKFISYGKTVIYRSKGAVEAAKLGAVAVLIRSITPFSLYTPHTGMMSYDDKVKKIPAACITVEDAVLLNRMAIQGDDLEINVKMEAKNYQKKQSRNLISEIKGTSEPKKVVVVSGHIDSWDVGQGAMDDGGGAFISWSSVVLLRRIGLRPKRTIRSIMWTGEELGIIGASQYIKSHKYEESNLQLVMESDMGTFEPLGLAVTGTDTVKCILNRVMSLLKPIGELGIRSPHGGPDIEEWVNSGIPGASLWNKNDKYFWYHHTNADTMLVEDSTSLDKGTAVFAAVSYVLADISIDLPRHNVTVSSE